jgi:Ner family transcriptional regulator
MDKTEQNRTDIPRDPIIRWEWIKYQLRVSGSSLAHIAREMNVTTPAVKKVKSSAYPRMERAIACALNLKPQLLWPERWNDQGAPHRLRPNRSEIMTSLTQKHNPANDQDHRIAAVRA